MRIAGTLSFSLCNGEGVRYVIFTQGCKHYCKGCHNPETWDFQGGYEISIEDLAEDIKGHKMIDGITLSGGDPFYQQEACIGLLKLLPNYNVWIYTGFSYNEIKDTELANMVNVLVTERFIPELKCEGKYYGSSNQKIIKIK